MSLESQFSRKLLKEFGKQAVRRVRPKIVSSKGRDIRVLQRALRAVLISDLRLEMQIPHYWAVYVHDGRGAPFGPESGTFLIWYKNPRQDPRLQGGVTPERAASLRTLSSADFKAALKADREARESGSESPVVITTRVKRSTPGVFFFGNRPGQGMAGFVQEANTTGLTLFRRQLLTTLKSTLGVTSFIPAVPAGGALSIQVERDEIRIPL